MKTKRTISRSISKQVESLLAKGKRSAFPVDVKPMLATLVDKPIEEQGWLYEIKWDGYRALGYINKKVADLKSRNNKSKFFPSLFCEVF